MVRDEPKLDWLISDLDTEDEVTKRALELLEREVHNAWASFLDSEKGRMIAWVILDKCHVLSSTYTGNASSNFLEGERHVGLRLLKEHILPFGPRVMAQMMEEADDRFERLMQVAVDEQGSRRATDDD